MRLILNAAGESARVSPSETSPGGRIPRPLTLEIVAKEYHVFPAPDGCLLVKHNMTRRGAAALVMQIAEQLGVVCQLGDVG